MFYDFLYQAEDGIRDGHVTGVQTCALPISNYLKTLSPEKRTTHCGGSFALRGLPWLLLTGLLGASGFLFLPRLTVSKRDRKSTRLNSSHVAISYAVFCLKKKKAI